MLHWIADEEPLPPAETALGQASEAPGLLAAGGRLVPGRLEEAYRSGIFPWYGPGQPVLWWSPDPRMVLPLEDFRLSQSLRKTLRRFLRTPGCALRFDHDCDAVIAACAGAPRPGQDGTWIVPAMRQAYRAWHRAGRVHSAEAWVDGELVGGLYFVAIGRMVFGESMFARRTDASKLALAALVAACRSRGVAWIDCQQNTGHLASLGAREVPRAAFLAHVRAAAGGPDPRPWAGEATDWAWLPELGLPAAHTDGGAGRAARPSAQAPSRARPEGALDTPPGSVLDPPLDSALATPPDAMPGTPGTPGTPGDTATDSPPGHPPPARAASD